MYTLTLEDMTRNANSVKEELLNALHRKEFITKEQLDDLSANYCMIMHRKGTFGKLWDKVRGITGDDLRVSLVKVI